MANLSTSQDKGHTPQRPQIRATQSTVWLRRGVIGVLAVLALIAILLVTARLFIGSASGARFIENQINSRSFGPVEGVTIDGLTGNPLGVFTIKSLEVRDKDGVFLTAENIAVDWSPWMLRSRHMKLNVLEAEKIDIVRRPILNPTEPSTQPLPRITAPKIRVPELLLGEQLINQQAVFAVESALSYGDARTDISLDATRTDTPGDRMTLKFSQNESGVVDGDFSIIGVADGPIATIMEAPQSVDVRGAGTVAGTLGAGDGTFSLAFGANEAATGTLEWSDASAKWNANISVGAWPQLTDFRDQIGPDLTIRGNVERPISEARFQIDLNAAQLALTADGRMPKDGYTPQAANIDLKISAPGDVMGLPDGYKMATTQIKGALTNTEIRMFEGTVTANNVTTPYGAFTSVSGPFSATARADSQYQYNATISLKGPKLTQTLPIKTGPQITFQSAGQIDLGKTRLDIQSAQITSASNQITARGRVNWAEPTYKLNGLINTGMTAQGALPAGQLKANYSIESAGPVPTSKLSTTKTSLQPLLALTSDGSFTPNIPLAEPFGGLVGERLVFKTAMTPIAGGINITDMRISGDHFRAALQGRVADIYDVSGEAIIDVATSYNGVSLGDASDASFRLEGPRDNPDLRLEARANTVTYNDIIFETPRLRAEVNDILKAPKGPLQFDADTEYGPLSFSTQFASRPGVMVADDIALSVGKLSATGNLSRPETGLVTGEVALDLPEENDRYAKAVARFEPRGDEQGIVLKIDAKNIAVRDFEFDTITATSEGTLAQSSGQITAKGQRSIGIVSRKFNADVPLTLTRKNDSAYHVTMQPEITYGKLELGHSEAVSGTYEAGTISVTAPLLLASQPLSVIYAKSAELETLNVETEGLPVTLIPMGGNLADSRGQFGALIALRADGTGVSGTANINVSDWRGFDMERQSGINIDLDVGLDENAVTATLTGKSPSGLNMKGDGKLRLEPATQISELRLDMNAPLLGNFKADGSAASIFGLVTPSEAELGGEIGATLSITGTASTPQIDGDAFGSGISFEAPELGTQVRNGNFKMDFTDDRLRVSRFSFSDSGKGTLEGTGDFKLSEFGRPIGTLEISANRFQLLDRRDLNGNISGELGYSIKENSAALTGNLTINNAEIRQFLSGQIDVIEVDVEEVNRPEDLALPTEPAAAIPLTLDVRVRAPNKIYVRSRGLNVELSLDTHITGTLSEPSLSGVAEIVRGAYVLAGRELAFTSGAVTFNGPVSDANVALEAQGESNGLTAYINISGTVGDPKVELTSTPERPQDEILSILLFGRSATELSAIEAAQLAGALAQFSGSGTGFDLLGGIRDTLGIGQLTVGFSEDGTAQIKGGRYIADNVYLQVFSGAGQSETGAAIEWEIRKNLAILSRLQADDNQSLALKYKRDF